MEFDAYIAEKQHELANKKIPQEIKERWQTRICTRQLHTLGRTGAVQYLADYGKGLAAPKAINLARMAASEGCEEMALEFWAKAFELETGQTVPRVNVLHVPVSSQVEISRPTATLSIPELPTHLQPGNIITMQATDAPSDRLYYINNIDYWGQPKRDGQRVIVCATSQGIFYQSRSTRFREQPTLEIQVALEAASKNLGTFVLDGELYYRAADGSEHRTGAQAATTNIELGQATEPPQPVYAIFSALYSQGQSLTDLSQAQRIDAGEAITQVLTELCHQFELVPTARAKEEKLALVSIQQREGREGEIWVQKSCRYIGGKDGKRLPIVRTKNYNDMELVITDLTPTTAEGRAFGAALTAELVNGELIPRGAVGAGFNQQNMWEIFQLHKHNPGKVKILVRTQGLTEIGQLWHGRYLGLI